MITIMCMLMIMIMTGVFLPGLRSRYSSEGWLEGGPDSSKRCDARKSQTLEELCRETLSKLAES